MLCFLNHLQIRNFNIFLPAKWPPFPPKCPKLIPPSTEKDEYINQMKNLKLPFISNIWTFFWYFQNLVGPSLSRYLLKASSNICLIFILFGKTKNPTQINFTDAVQIHMHEFYKHVNSHI